MARPRNYEEPLLPTPDLISHAKALLEFGGEGARFILMDREADHKIELNEDLFALFRNILIDLSQNRAVQILPHDLELTTVQAAEFLQVSRPHLIKLIDQEKLECRMVGTHRRIRLADLMQYQQEFEQRSKAVRQKLTREAQKLGLGY